MRAERAKVFEEVAAHHAHDLPERLSGFQFRREREVAQESDVDRRDELVQHIALHTEPARRAARSPAVEPLRGLEPAAELLRVLVQAEGL